MRKRKLLNVLYGGDMATGVVFYGSGHCWLWNGETYYLASGSRRQRIVSMGRVKDGRGTSNAIRVNSTQPHWKDSK